MDETRFLTFVRNDNSHEVAWTECAAKPRILSRSTNHQVSFRTNVRNLWVTQFSQKRLCAL